MYPDHGAANIRLWSKLRDGPSRLRPGMLRRASRCRAGPRAQRRTIRIARQDRIAVGVALRRDRPGSTKV
jgi:hypothetical protein